MTTYYSSLAAEALLDAADACADAGQHAGEASLRRASAFLQGFARDTALRDVGSLLRINEALEAQAARRADRETSFAGL